MNKIDPTEKQRILDNARIGLKGYTIPKDCLSHKTLNYLYEDLSVKPFINVRIGAPDAGAQGFPCYRENGKKIYIPRFYGEKLFGTPKVSDLEIKNQHNLTFAKTLRDYQIEIVKIYMEYVNRGPCGGGAILEVPCGRGKCLGKDTPIMMYDGKIKMVQDIVVGDLIMGDDSKSRKVLSLARGREMMYKVVPKKGDPYIVNESHILSLKYSTTMNTKTPKGTVRDISVLDYLGLPKSYHGRGGPLVGYRVPLLFPKKEVSLDPYLLGYWLGDGNSRGPMISTQDSRVLRYLNGTCFPVAHPDLYLKYTGDQYDYRINSTSKISSLTSGLRKYNLVLNKHIPQDYKCNDRYTQLQVLAGIIDADGSLSSNSFDLIQKNETLIDDVIFLVRSLGFAAYKSKCTKSCMYKGDRKEGTYFRICIHGKGLDEIPVKCLRKKARPRKQIKDALNTRIHLEKLDVDDYYGFEIDGNRRFVLGDFTVTHNTVMSLDIISKIRQKTIIIVHKEFLMNQWIERIQEFLPDARVGKIQGPVFDIEDKDIVIGMLQTLYAKDFGAKAFQSFGLTIIDEVHRIGSEQFSKALFKVVTPYMLGISATVERKDRLTNVLYMFIGDRIYNEAREKDDKVVVRGLKFLTNDSAFNETEYDFRGSPKYSTMISKVCNYGPRSDFIVRILADLFAEHPDKQVMVLAHNRALLVYFYEAINNKGFASCGYYVGGMKQSALEETEGKQIVLATYAMAAEALDIKTLSTLVMASPKTDITQSVGRILRVKGNNPIVIDVIDSHDHFSNQWNARKKFYKKNGYFIQMVSSKDYVDMTNESPWKILYDPETSTSNSKEDKPKCLLKF